ncbi:ELMO domain-containing protein 2 isoform X1 [Lingula anatina]|uniref:ELMO domain-containing protein 2 isoform X1 n=1 Tax=Lingula anatina TaxID=7574 RepID=A0A1S3H598_LINAN|nr:ELMO domain-containing protein 2 isoform X1 [Lingula anatina]XP_013380635.1 ELMO domain-containing protein 2 isoform X1 [Lingula anatina]XP_013380636.1 ELMO domain-containing protein 2 isoform X1 [Lingula anatina]|eukprot:XP_013380634.1 ELMO domain-containing protein 2 isoform X1 [Lingula anatina]
MFSVLCNRVWYAVYFTLLHPMLKWLLRKVTGKCELLRISYGEQVGAPRTRAIEKSLKHSKFQALKRLLTDNHVNIDQAVEQILSIKSITVEVHPQFQPTIHICLTQICGYREFITELESVRKTPYSSENNRHEEMLLELWRKLMPDVPLQSRYNRQWGDIGFQGDDPMTDFRGMGLLGLQNLLYFATQHNSTARQVLSHSHHPQYGYSFAIVGINLTGVAHQLLISGALKTHFYNVVQGKPKLDHFHQVYCYLFHEFDKFWLAEKPHIMEFNKVKAKFAKRIVMHLKDRNATLSMKCVTSEAK